MNQNTRNVATLVIELGLEELPPKAMRTLALAFAEGVQTALQQARLTPTTVMPLAAPRRLAVMVTGLARSQSDDTQVLRGPPLKVAFDEAGEPTRAAIAFADKNGVSVDALEREITDKGEWLQVTRHIQGRSAEQIIAELLGAVAESLPIPKRMRWGDSTASFVRPLHWLMVMLDDAVVDCELFGVKSGNKSRGHRFHANEWFELDAAVHYVQALENRQVIVEMDKRTAVVRDQVTTLAKSLDGAVEPDEALVEEITALCDWPVAIAGQFDARFLQLPSEVLSATLKVHQRYFPVVDREGQQTRHFITVANIDSVNPQAVQQGNERVIAPRLADAAFFWDNDCKQPLSARVDRLLNIVYQRELGSIADKSARTIAIATQLAEQLHIDVEPIQRAALLARCDLVTDMVGEFPELQGVMGAYYAARDGEPESVVAAIRDQYKPAFAGDAIPSNQIGQVLAVAERLDTLAGIFAIGKKPSGNKDPFGLRRTALGLVRILTEAPLDVALAGLLDTAVNLQPVDIEDAQALCDDVLTFITERARNHYRSIVPDDNALGIFEAVRASAPPTWFDFEQRLHAVVAFAALPEANALAAANKRISNLLKQTDLQAAREIDTSLFGSDEERTLHTAIDAAETDLKSMLAALDYQAALMRLSQTRVPVDQFFDRVMVMADDVAVRNNRLALLAKLRGLFVEIADVSVLAG